MPELKAPLERSVRRGETNVKTDLKKGVIAWIRFICFRTLSSGSVLDMMINLCFS
jgi:hypothetical protein